MRNADAQREDIMVRVSTSRQAPGKHVSHARSGAFRSDNYDGQRCALLTTKSRKTCTRATVFNSSGYTKYVSS
jgi:hypothetical protein